MFLLEGTVSKKENVPNKRHQLKRQNKSKQSEEDNSSFPEGVQVCTVFLLPGIPFLKNLKQVWKTMKIFEIKDVSLPNEYL